MRTTEEYQSLDSIDRKGYEAQSHQPLWKDFSFAENQEDG
jgi:hypothetical protein